MEPADKRNRLFARLEIGAVLLLFIAALVPRLRDLDASFDREMEGFQGSCFAGFAINYERFGVGTWGGYPTFNVLVPSEAERTPYLYPNHPPLVPLVGWASMHAFGPEGWDTAWESGAPPEGAELSLRLPFFLAHLFGLLGLWWAVRQASGKQVALLTLAIAAFVPLSIGYATLVNYENPYLFFLLPAVGFHIRWLQKEHTRDLIFSGAFLFASACVTFFPAFFVPPLVLQTWHHRGFRKAFRQGLLFAACALLPALAHGFWVKANVPPPYPDAVQARMVSLWEPLLSGAAPVSEWARRQLIRCAWFFSEPLLIVSAVGGLLLAIRGLRRNPSGTEGEGPSVGLPLAGGGALILFGFYGHTFDGPTATTGQTLFLMNLVPAVCVLAAHALDALAPRLYRLRGGVAPLVVVTSLIALPALGRAGAIRAAWREPGAADTPPGELGPGTPLPITAGEELRAILPAGTIGLFPRGMGFTAAVRYYAWRQVFPVDYDTWGDVITRIDQAFGLGDVPRYMVVPKHPTPAARALTERVRSDLAEQFTMIDETDRWELWPAFE